MEWGRVRVLDAPVLALRHFGRDPLPIIEHELKDGQALMDTARLELQADQVQRTVGEPRDKQMFGNAVVVAVIQRMWRVGWSEGRAMFRIQLVVVSALAHRHREAQCRLTCGRAQAPDIFYPLEFTDPPSERAR